VTPADKIEVTLQRHETNQRLEKASKQRQKMLQ
jgi:hypothetical protein